MTEHKAKEFCSIHGLVMKIMWVMLCVAAAYAGTSIGFALDMRTTMAKLTTVSERTTLDVKELQLKQASIDSKLDQILDAVKGAQ